MKVKEKYYLKATEEFDAGDVEKALWSKAVAQSEGDENKAKYRYIEERAAQLYGMGHIGGFCHLYIGQEAVVVGLESVAAEGDQRVTSYRDHGHMIACGMNPKNVMSELTGKHNGYSKG